MYPHPRIAAASLLGLLLALYGCAMHPHGAQSSREEGEMPRPRLLVLTDIGGDPDDRQSMIRLLHYANDFEIEGLIASAAGTPGELGEAVVKPELIAELVAAYGEIRDNLALHDPRYPHAEELRARIRAGNPQRGREHVGDAGDTEGSRWIIEVVDRPAEGPVNVAIWGGQSDLAQALWRVRRDRGDEGLRRFVQRLRVYDIADQDEIADWMRGEFAGLFYVLNRASPDADRRDAAFRGMYLGGDESLTSRNWIDAHVRVDHGPLGALYPTETWTAPNPHGVMKEGDTPSWFYFLPWGPGDAAHPEWGGWGGRFEPDGGGLYRDAQDTVQGTTDARATVWRWRPAFQADFQSRMDWAVRPYAEANHPPVARIAGERRRTVEPGEGVVLDATASQDPDGDDLAYRWYVYPEAGTYRGEVTIEGATSERATVVAPRVTAPTTVHLLLEVTDGGEPRLTRYGRVVLNIQP
jgi:hypothetical protein